jgi:6-phosphogluconolactonase (cycloisomerase 2 family)
VFVFRFDDAAGRLSPTEQASVSARAGSGPRHLAFHPKAPVVWTLNELSSTVTTYAWDAERGALHPLQILTSLPANFTGDNTAAEIAVSSDGRFVYCSNRGHDSVAVFAANARTGLLTPIAWTPTKGRSPRFITLDPAGRFLYAANEQGDTIAQFRVDPAHGVLRSAGEFIRTASPVTIAFAGFH